MIKKERIMKEKGQAKGKVIMRSAIKMIGLIGNEMKLRGVS